MEFSTQAPAFRGRVHGEPCDLYTPPKTSGEYIVAAAILDLDNGDIYLGAGHHDARQTMPMDRWRVMVTRPNLWPHGFFTSEGRFVDRAEGLRLAGETEQVTAAAVRGAKEALDSDDLVVSETENTYLSYL